MINIIIGFGLSAQKVKTATSYKSKKPIERYGKFIDQQKAIKKETTASIHTLFKAFCIIGLILLKLNFFEFSGF